MTDITDTKSTDIADLSITIQDSQSPIHIERNGEWVAHGITDKHYYADKN